MKEFAVIRKFLRQNISGCMRPANSRLPHPFLDPSECYLGNLWDWDSYYTAMGIAQVIADGVGAPDFDAAAERERLAACAVGSVLDFLALMDDEGRLPIMATEDGVFERFLTDEYRAGRPVNQHKPVFCQNVLQAGELAGNYDFLDGRFEALERYFAFYKSNQFCAPAGLYVFRSDVMIGVDNNPAVFGRPADSCGDLLLNCLMLRELAAMQKLCARFSPERQAFYRGEYDNLAQAVEEQCWDEWSECYYPVDVQVATPPSPYFHKNMQAFWRSVPLKLRSFLAFLPLYAGIASRERAERLVRRHWGDETLFCPFGIRTLASTERMYNLDATTNPSNWLGAVWGISNYMVFCALRDYGFPEEAAEMAERTVRLFARDIEAHGTLSESYYPDTGEPVMNGGFLSWNFLVIEMIRYLESCA